MQRNRRKDSSRGHVMQGLEGEALRVELDHVILAPTLYTVLQWGFPHQDLREETRVCLIRSSIPLPHTLPSSQYMFNE